MSSYSAKIHYKHARKGTHAWCSNKVSTNQLKGNTESAVLEYLQRHHPNDDIQVLDIEWR